MTTPRRRGGATGWYGRPDWRLDAHEAHAAAALLEGHGWRAEAVSLAQGIALVEVRRLAVRGTPLVAVLRRRGRPSAGWRRTAAAGAPSSRAGG